MSGVARAMVFDGPGQPLRPVKISLPVPGPGEVLVRVEMCTLCGSDLHTYFGRRPGPTPCVLGHEIVGRVEALPERDVPRDAIRQPLKVGQRVVWGIAVACRRCYYCERDLPQKCETGWKYGHKTFSPGAELVGGLSTHCLLAPQTVIHGAPDDVPTTALCPVGCATATVSAALPLADVVLGDMVLVLGAGMLGLTACNFARWLGASAILACDPNPRRRDAALRYGAKRAVAPDDLARAVAEETDGHGVGLAVDFSGSTAAIAAALEHVRMGGTLVLAGSVFPGEPLTVRPDILVRRQLTLQGVHNYHYGELQPALNFLRAQPPHHPLADLVSATFPLDRADDAFRAAATGEHVRVAVVP